MIYECAVCESDNVSTTLMGGGDRDMNTVRCHDCKAYGYAQDWSDIAVLKRKLKQLEETK